MYRPKLVASNVKPKLVSRQTAAKMLGDVHTKTVDRLIQRGLLRGVNVGARKMVDPDSIDAFIDRDQAEAGVGV
jgi:hypothetical protein